MNVVFNTSLQLLVTLDRMVLLNDSILPFLMIVALFSKPLIYLRTSGFTPSNSRPSYATQFSTNASEHRPQALAGTPALDVTTILAFGQPVIVHLTKTKSKLNYRGEQGYALCPSAHSRGYHIYIPKNHQVVDSTNYAVIKSGITIEKDQEYDATIFDDIINTFTSNEEYTMINTPPSDESNTNESIIESILSPDDSLAEISSTTPPNSDLLDDGISNPLDDISIQQSSPSITPSLTDQSTLVDNNDETLEEDDHLSDIETLLEPLDTNIPDAAIPSDNDTYVHESSSNVGERLLVKDRGGY